MKKNLRLRLLTGQMILVEDVTDYTIDANGIHVTNQETTVEKVGEEMKKIITVSKKWFNTAGVVTFAEEFVKA